MKIYLDVPVESVFTEAVFDVGAATKVSIGSGVGTECSLFGVVVESVPVEAFLASFLQLSSKNPIVNADEISNFIIFLWCVIKFTNYFHEFFMI